jgi:hypothetical protein
MFPRNGMLTKAEENANGPLKVEFHLLLRLEKDTFPRRVFLNFGSLNVPGYPQGITCADGR